MYQEVCFNRGTEAGEGELMWATRSAPPPPRSFYACYGPVMSLTVQCELDDTQFCYQLIITITIFVIL